MTRGELAELVSGRDTAVGSPRMDGGVGEGEGAPAAAVSPKYGRRKAPPRP